MKSTQQNGERTVTAHHHIIIEKSARYAIFGRWIFSAMQPRSPHVRPSICVSGTDVQTFFTSLHSSSTPYCSSSIWRLEEEGKSWAAGLGLGYGFGLVHSCPSSVDEPIGVSIRSHIYEYSWTTSEQRAVSSREARRFNTKANQTG